MRGEGGVADEGRLVDVLFLGPVTMALTNMCSDWMPVTLSGR